MGSVYAVVDTIYKTYISNKDRWLWWLFFPSILARGLEGFAKAQDEESKSKALIQIFEIFNGLWWISKWLFPFIKTISQLKAFSVYQTIKSNGLNTNILRLYLQSPLNLEQCVDFFKSLKNHSFITQNHLNRLITLKVPVANVVTINAMLEAQLFSEVFFETLCEADLSEQKLSLIALMCKKAKFSSEVFECISQLQITDLQFNSLKLLVDCKYFDNNLMHAFCRQPHTQLQLIVPLINKLTTHQLLDVINPLKYLDQEIYQAIAALEEFNILSKDNIILMDTRTDRNRLIQCFSYLLKANCFNPSTRQAVIDETELENLVWLLELGHFKVSEQFLMRSDKSKVYALVKTLVEHGLIKYVNIDDENFLTVPEPEILTKLINRFHAIHLLDEKTFITLVKHKSLIDIAKIFDAMGSNADSFATLRLKQLLDFSYPEVLVKLIKHRVLTKENMSYLFNEIIFHPQPTYLKALSELNAVDNKLVEYLMTHPKSLQLKICFDALVKQSISNKILIDLVNMVNEDVPIEIVLVLLNKNQLMTSSQGLDNLNAIIQHRFILLGDLLKPFWEKVSSSNFTQVHLDKILHICQSKKMLAQKIENIAKIFLIELMQLNQTDVDKKSFLSPALFLVESKSTEIAFHYYQHFYPKSKDDSKIDQLMIKISALDCPRSKKKNAFSAVAQYLAEFYDPISNVNLASLFVMIYEVINQFSEPNSYWLELVDALDLLFLMQPGFEKMFDHLSKLLNSFYEKQYSMKMNVLYLKDEVIGLIRENTELFIKLFPDAKNLPVSILPIWDTIKTKLYPNTQGLLEPYQVDNLAQQIKVSPEEVRYKTLFISQISILEPIAEEYFQPSLSTS